MSVNNPIKYLTHQQIDKKKWDACIDNSSNGLIYSYSFYLDAMAKQWDALVLNDYEAVMPLPIRKKGGFIYAYTPRFIGQLGITGLAPIHNDVLSAFINAIPKKYSYVDLLLNEYNIVEPAYPLLYISKTNYILPLLPTHDIIYNNYSKDAKKSLRQATALQLYREENIDPAIVIEMYRKAYGKLSNCNEKDYNSFRSLIQNAIHLEKGFTIGIKNIEGELLASAFLGRDTKRIYYLLGAPTAEGRKSNAVYFLINEVIKKFNGKNMIFDFEGSDIISVADFYKKFGPIAVNYSHLIINRLPCWIKWVKK